MMEPRMTTASQVASQSCAGFSPQMRRPNTWAEGKGVVFGKSSLRPVGGDHRRAQRFG